MAPKTNSTSNRMEQVRTALQTARTGTLRSALYHWMRQNHDNLTALFEEIYSGVGDPGRDVRWHGPQ